MMADRPIPMLALRASEMRLVQRMTYSAIAEKLHCTENTITRERLQTATPMGNA